MHRTSPPDLPPLPPAAPKRDVVAPWQQRNALYHLAAIIAHLIGSAFVLQWLADDWKAQWGDQSFFDAASFALDGTLVGAFGIWLLMAFLLFCLVFGIAQFALTAAVFRSSTRRSVLMVFAWLSILTPPAGTLAGLHALRNLKDDSRAP
jgi:hypothetical protein